MPSILGLPTTKEFDDQSAYFYNHRRQILHTFPRGGASLTGLLSMLATEPTNSFQTIWHEKRFKYPQTKTRGTNPITSDAPSTGDANDGTNMSAGSKAVTVAHYIKVDTTKDLRPGQVIQIEGSGGEMLQFRITGVTRGVTAGSENGYVTAYPVRAYTAAATDDHVAGSSGADAVVRVISTAMGEGAPGDGMTPAQTKIPINVLNQTQIFRTPFSFPGSVLQQPQKFDKSGPYKERAKDASLEHFTNVEHALIFGQRSRVIRPSLDGSGDEEVVTTHSGILEFLKLWDAGSTGLTIDGNTYAPYSHKGNTTSDDDDQKRIIENVNGEVSIGKFEGWAERVMRYHHSKSDEKLVLTGGGAIRTLNKLVRDNGTYSIESKEMYGLSINTLKTPFGDFHFLTHPLFNDDAVLRHWMLFLDIHSLKLRPLVNRDHKLLKNRQANNADKRTDEFLGEHTLELHSPERFMLVKNVTTAVAD